MLGMVVIKALTKGVRIFRWIHSLLVVMMKMVVMMMKKLVVLRVFLVMEKVEVGGDGRVLVGRERWRRDGVGVVVVIA